MEAWESAGEKSDYFAGRIRREMLGEIIMIYWKIIA